MAGRLPREMLASVVRRLSVPAGTGEILEALNYANQHLAAYYAWPWFLSEMTWTFRAPVTGKATISSSGSATLTSMSDGSADPTYAAGTLTPPTGRSSIGFTAYIADVSIDIATNEVVRGTLTLQRSGALTPTWKA